MSNAQNNPQQNTNGMSPHLQQQPAAPPTGNKPEHQFFRWIRESHVERTNDRVVAGVCGAIAREFGWDVTLIRVLMVVSVFFGGFGCVFYGIAWMLLPDEMDHRILLEEIIEGHWDWSFIGVILCILVAGCAGFNLVWGIGWGINIVPTLLAVLALYLVVDNGRRRFVEYREPNTPPAPQNNASYTQTPPVDSTQSPQQPAAPTTSGTAYQQPGQQPGQQAASQASPATAYQQPAQQSAPSAAPPYTNYVVQPQSSQAPQTAYKPTAASAQNVSIPVQMPPAHDTVKRARRKPAGPMLVLLVFGLLLASLGALSFVYRNNMSMSSAVQTAVIYAGAICAVIGLIIVVVGFCGKRTGGLHPFAWIAMFVACCAMAVGIGWSVTSHYKASIERHYTHIALTDTTQTIGSSTHEIEELKRGIAVIGTDYYTSELNIDLTDYAKNNKTQTIELNNGTTQKTTCPVGTIPMTVQNARVVITLPEGCSWGFSSSFDVHPTDSIGGAFSVMVKDNPATYIGKNIREELDFDDDDDETILSFNQPHIGSRQMKQLCTGIDVNNGKVMYGSNANATMKQWIADGHYWPCAITADEAPASPELLISPRVLIFGNISVQYALQQ